MSESWFFGPDPKDTPLSSLDGDFSSVNEDGDRRDNRRDDERSPHTRGNSTRDDQGFDD
jgi:hypothetical protein